MSQTASTNFITSFDTMVKQAYQGFMKLGGTVREKRNVTGSTHVFPKLGKGLAQQRIPQTDVVPMNVAHSKATATLSDWSAPEYADVYDLEKLSFDEKQELAQVVAGAIGRRNDQLILDAMAAGANSTQVDEDVGGTATGMNLAKILRAKRLLDDAGVPSDGQRHLAMSAQSLEDALAVTEIGSSDFNVLKALAAGELKTYAGFQFHMIETRDEGGLVVATNIRNNFAWHKAAVGIAIGMDFRTEVNYVPEKTSWLINGLFSAGSIVIDDAGVYDVLTDETP